MASAYTSSVYPNLSRRLSRILVVYKPPGLVPAVCHVNLLIYPKLSVVFAGESADKPYAAIREGLAYPKSVAFRLDFVIVHFPSPLGSR
jgi:hypothetical protein